MRPTWKGSISFGLVYIPVAVYPATREEKISFRQLRSSDLSPIRYKKVAEADSKEVPADQIVKGFEYERGRYVVMKDEDFEKVRIESTHSIDITDFVDLEQVDPKFFYKPYFLEPQKGGEKAYAVLHKALSRYRQDRHCQGRDQQPRTFGGGETGWVVSDSGADALRQRNIEHRGFEEWFGYSRERQRIEDGAGAHR